MAILRLLFTLTLAGFGLAVLGGCAGIMNKSQVIQIDGMVSDHARELTRNGADLVHRGDIDLAEEAFKQAIRSDESYGPAHNNLGRVYFERRDLRRAAEAFTWAMEFMPGRPEPMNNLGLVFEEADNLMKAIEFYEQAHFTAPENSEYLANLVRARIRGGNRGAEVREGLQTLRLIENRPDWTAWVAQNLAALPSNEVAADDDVSSASLPNHPREMVGPMMPPVPAATTEELLGPEFITLPQMGAGSLSE